jgi:hypothetical protein
MQAKASCSSEAHVTGALKHADAFATAAALGPVAARSECPLGVRPGWQRADAKFFERLLYPSAWHGGATVRHVRVPYDRSVGRCPTTHEPANRSWHELKRSWLPTHAFPWSLAAMDRDVKRPLKDEEERSVPLLRSHRLRRSPRAGWRVPAATPGDGAAPGAGHVNRECALPRSSLRMALAGTRSRSSPRRSRGSSNDPGARALRARPSERGDNDPRRPGRQDRRTVNA